MVDGFQPNRAEQDLLRSRLSLLSSTAMHPTVSTSFRFQLICSLMGLLFLTACEPRRGSSDDDDSASPGDSQLGGDLEVPDSDHCESVAGWSGGLQSKSIKVDPGFCRCQQFEQSVIRD